MEKATVDTPVTLRLVTVAIPVERIPVRDIFGIPNVFVLGLYTKSPSTLTGLLPEVELTNPMY